MATRLVKSSPPCKLQSVLENYKQNQQRSFGGAERARSDALEAVERDTVPVARKSQTNYTVIKTKQSCFPNKRSKPTFNMKAEMRFEGPLRNTNQSESLVVRVHSLLPLSSKCPANGTSSAAGLVTIQKVS
jgi:hypothetical protein